MCHTIDFLYCPYLNLRIYTTLWLGTCFLWSIGCTRADEPLDGRWSSPLKNIGGDACVPTFERSVYSLFEELFGFCIEKWQEDS